MENLPLVTAIITTHNRKELVNSAIKSVLEQTYRNIECIVIDDFSTDGTREAVEHYINSGLIKYYYIEKDETKGANYARNKGILFSTGKYIAFLDDDDEWLPTKIEKQVQIIENNNVELVYCGRIYEKDFETKYEDNIQNIKKYPEGNIGNEVIIRVVLVTSTILIRKDLLVKVGMFDEKLQAWQEYELVIRALQNINVAVVRENLVLYRIISKDKKRISSNVRKWEKSVMYIESKHKELIRKLSIVGKARRLFYKYLDGYIRAKSEGVLKKQIKYAFKIIINPGTLIIAILKKTVIKDGSL